MISQVLKSASTSVATDASQPTSCLSEELNPHKDTPRIVLIHVLKALSPIVAVVMVLLTFVILMKVLVYCDWGNCSPAPARLLDNLRIQAVDSFRMTDIDSQTTSEERLRREYEYYSSTYSSRIWWTLLGAICIVCSIACYCAAIHIVYKYTAKYKVGLKIAVSTLLLLLTGTVGVVLYRNPEILTKTLVQMAKLTIHIDVPIFRDVFSFINAFSFSALALLLLSEVLVLLPDRTLSQENAFEDIKRKTSYLNIILLIGTVMLVTAVLVIQYSFRWMISFLVQDTTIQSITVLTQNLTTVWSIELTLLLAAAYLPGYFVLKSYAQEVFLPDRPEQSAKLKEVGLTLTLSEFLTRFLTILAPLLVNPVLNSFFKILEQLK